MSAVVAEARRWLGTPYLHQASTRGAGTDCLGLVRGLWRRVYGREPEGVPPYTQDWAEPQGQEVLWDAALRHMVAVSAARPWKAGECLLFRMREGGVAKHLGVLTETTPIPRFIHAYSGHGVVEMALSRPWARRVVARFDFPDLPKTED